MLRHDLCKSHASMSTRSRTRSRLTASQLGFSALLVGGLLIALLACRSQTPGVEEPVATTQTDPDHADEVDPDQPLGEGADNQPAQPAADKPGEPSSNPLPRNPDPPPQPVPSPDPAPNPVPNPPPDPVPSPG